MFRLRLYCPFGGHGHNIFFLGVVLVSLSVMTAVSNNWNIFASIIIPTITVFVGGYIWVNRITYLDKRNMDKADFLLWHPLSDDDREKVIEGRTFSLSSYIFILAIIVIFAITPAKNSSSRGNQFSDSISPKISFAVMTLLAVVMVLDYINSLRWKTVDDTAVCAVVPVHLHFSVEHYSRGSRWTNNYIVIYLPDGKYILPSDLEGSQSVKIVKFGGMLTYFEDDVDEELLKWKE
ncbi:MAG: hypothetical protein J6B01_02535 [Ruminococcus sp.]|nr:hypothetical protein [Ruminococcus sp.]